MNWDLSTAIGKLTLFWWWCVDYAEDGDLRKHNAGRIAVAMDVPFATADPLRFAMIQSGFIDEAPYLRVHDWWDYIGRFLQVKYKTKPSRWHYIKSLYIPETERVSEEPLQQPLFKPLLPERSTLNDQNVPTFKRLNDANGSTHPEVSKPATVKRSSSNRAFERDMMGKLREVLGEDEMARAGGHWRKDWVRSNPGLLQRALNELGLQLKEGNTIENRGAWLEDLLKRWK